MNRRLCLFAGYLGSLLLFAGCGSDQAQVDKQTSNLKPLAIYYGRYINNNRGKPPASEEQLKEFIRSRPESEREALGATDVDSLFISSRDGKPYVVLYNVGGGMPGPPGQMTVIAYEQEGVNGLRYVAGSLGQIEEVDQARLRELEPDAQ